MLTEAIIERSISLRICTGRERGSCFGVSDPSRLRGATKPRTRDCLAEYTLTFEDPHKKPAKFKAKNRWEALVAVKQSLDIRGRLSVKKFIDAGGKCLRIGERQVFPQMQ